VTKKFIILMDEVDGMSSGMVSLIICLSYIDRGGS